MYSNGAKRGMAGTTNQALEEKKKEERTRVRHEDRNASTDNLDNSSNSDNSNYSGTEVSQSSLDAIILASLVDSL